MNFNEYQNLATRTRNNTTTPDLELLNYSLGLAGETGEVIEMIKKTVFHGHEINSFEIQKELGDVLWYLSQIARMAGLTLDEIASTNIEKLRKRYPIAFSKEASINRPED